MINRTIRASLSVAIVAAGFGYGAFYETHNLMGLLVPFASFPVALMPLTFMD